MQPKSISPARAAVAAIAFGVCAATALAEDPRPECGLGVKVIESPDISDYFPPPQCEGGYNFVGLVTLESVIGVDGHVLASELTSTKIEPSTSAPCAEYLAHRQALATRYSTPDTICRKEFHMRFKGYTKKAA
jgi:hypothetical protein